MPEDFYEKMSRCMLLHTARLFLRPFTIRDADAVLKYGSDKKVLEYLSWQGVSTRQEAEKMIPVSCMRAGVYALALKQDNTCIGVVDVQFDESDNTAMIGYILDSAYWNKGYMTEAVRQVIEAVFDMTGVCAVTADCDARNAASKRVLEKCGMKPIRRDDTKIYWMLRKPL